MKIYNYLSKECVDVTLSPAGSKEELFENLIRIAGSHYKKIDTKAAMEGLLKREKLGSTGVGKEIAIPHAGIKGCDGIKTVVGIIKEGMEFQSIDNLPVKIVFMILFPADDIPLQLKFLARISRLLRKEELRTKLMEAASPPDVIDIFRSYEDKHFG